MAIVPIQFLPINGVYTSKLQKIAILLGSNIVHGWSQILVSNFVPNFLLHKGPNKMPNRERNWTCKRL